MSEATIGVTGRMFDLTTVPIQMAISGTTGVPIRMSIPTPEPEAQSAHRVIRVLTLGGCPAMAGVRPAIGTATPGRTPLSQRPATERLAARPGACNPRESHAIWKSILGWPENGWPFLFWAAELAKFKSRNTAAQWLQFAPVSAIIKA